jgi:hypothetical protein
MRYHTSQIMTKDLFARVCWGVALALLGLPLIVRFGVIAGSSVAAVRDVVDFVFDDGYYYLAIAANLADTGHSTLDGSTPTNGYQPLWLLVLSGFARLTGTRPWPFFVASCALVYTLALLGPLLALAWWRSTWRPAALAFAAGLAIVVIQQPEAFLQGLEPILFLPLALPLVALLESASDSAKLTLLSLVLALAFLVRLDALSLYCAAVLVLTAPLLRTRPVSVAARESLFVVLRLSVFVVPVAAIYLVVNKALFGTAVPVSGVAKMIGGPLFSNWGVALELFSRWKSFALLLVLLVPLEWLARAAGHSDRVFYRSITVVSIAAVIQTFYYCAFSTWHVWPWYAYLVALDMALVAGRIIHLGALLRAGAPLGRAAAFVAVGVIGAWGLYRAAMFMQRSLVPGLPAGASLASTLTGRELKKEVSFNQVSVDMLNDFFRRQRASPRSTVIAMGDRAGGLAYWGRADLSLEQTEGLTLGMDYIRARVAGRGADYLAQRYPLEYYVVDREYIPAVTAQDGSPELVIADPIQGSITTAPVPTFCFPSSAVQYRQAYPAQYGVNTRIAFAFAARLPCPPQALELVQSAAKGIGLRRFSLPSEP